MKEVAKSGSATLASSRQAAHSGVIPEMPGISLLICIEFRLVHVDHSIINVTLTPVQALLTPSPTLLPRLGEATAPPFPIFRSYANLWQHVVQQQGLCLLLPPAAQKLHTGATWVAELLRHPLHADLREPCSRHRGVVSICTWKPELLQIYGLTAVALSKWPDAADGHQRPTRPR